MARSAKTTTKAAPAAPAASTRITKARAAEPPAAQPALAKGKAVRATPAQASPKLAPERGSIDAASVTAVAPTRVPPPSKGELRAQIEKLETANATLKAKSREANRAAKVSARRIAELEEQVAQFETAATKVAASVATPSEVNPVRRGRPPGRSKAIDPGDAVPPGVAVQKSEPLDEKTTAARDALEEHFSGE